MCPNSIYDTALEKSWNKLSDKIKTINHIIIFFQYIMVINPLSLRRCIYVFHQSHNNFLSIDIGQPTIFERMNIYLASEAEWCQPPPPPQYFMFSSKGPGSNRDDEKNVSSC